MGKHQDATRHSMDFSFYNSNDGMGTFGAYIGNGVFDNYFNIGVDRNQDKNYGNSKGVIYSKENIFSERADDIGYDYTNQATAYTSRPINTSLLYCIKYK